MSAKSNAPIIIKRKKVVAGGGHHGGAWKVAYADFVTAMMAFFLLMWLLNATTEKQRKGVADYFSPTIPVNRISGGGDGAFGGDSVFTEETLARNGTGASLKNPTVDHEARGDQGTGDAEAGEKEAEDAAAIANVQSALSAMSGESMVAEQALRHIVTKVTDEGLIVEVFDLPGEPLFERTTSEPTEITYELMEMMGNVFALVKNEIAANGHMASQALAFARNPVWDLSSARADKMRQMLEDEGIPSARIQRVSGFADRKRAVSNPMAVRNNRIELILLRQDR